MLHLRSRVRALACALAATSLSLLAPSATGQALITEDFSSGYFQYDAVIGGGNTYHFYHGQQKRDMPTTGSPKRPRVTSNGHLDLAVGHTTGGRDRVEFRLVHGSTDRNTFAVKMDQNREYRFRLYIHPDTQHPKGWLHVSQIWQRGAPKLVPFVLTLRAGAKSNEYELMMVAKGTDGERWANPDSNGKDSPLATLKEGTFYDVKVRFRVAPVRKGENKKKGFIRVDIDGVTKASKQVYMGTKSGVNGAENAFDVRVGIYREGQKAHTRLLFDDLWFGS